ncbi:MAG: hypothetical protein ABH870_08370, partial [bacterium]
MGFIEWCQHWGWVIVVIFCICMMIMCILGMIFGCRHMGSSGAKGEWWNCCRELPRNVEGDELNNLKTSIEGLKEEVRKLQK